jgi:hypothetical protein
MPLLAGAGLVAGGADDCEELFAAGARAVCDWDEPPFVDCWLVVAGVLEAFGGEAIAPPPPQAARARAASAITAALARRLVGLFRVMSLLQWEH